LAMTAVCLGMAAVVYAPAAALTWPATMPSGRVLAALATLAVLCTAVAFLLFFRLIAEIGPARATVITYVNPAVAVTLGVLVLGERLTPAMAAAFALILGGSVLAARSGAGRGQAGAPEAGPVPAQPGPAEQAVQPAVQSAVQPSVQPSRAAPET
jgi:drug/metabolite transporter (DMT)-like permease